MVQRSESRDRRGTIEHQCEIIVDACRLVVVPAVYKEREQISDDVRSIGS